MFSVALIFTLGTAGASTGEQCGLYLAKSSVPGMKSIADNTNEGYPLLQV
jgi:hypothetical protein